MAKNPYLGQFHDDLRARYPTDGADMTYSKWVCANTYLGARKFSTVGYEFQAKIIDDLSPDLSVIKPSQVGMTEVQVRKFLALLARNRGTSGIFSFPSEKMFRSNSKTRIKPIVNQPAFKSTSIDDERPHRAMSLYEINGSFAHITGLTEGDATSTPADFLFHDELDLSDQAMIGLFQSRIQNSDWRLTQKFSTPTFAGFGIDAAYAASDQHEYMVRCTACNHWQVPLFDMRFVCLPGYRGEGDLELLDADAVSMLDLAEACFVCEHCSRPLDLRSPELREWVAAFPARKSRGYRIRPSSTFRLGPAYIITQLLKFKDLDNVKGWRNTVLGETHSDGNSKLEPDVVKAVMGSPAVPEVGGRPVALGLDMGKTCHLVLGDAKTADAFYWEQIPSNRVEERVAELRKEYNIITGGVDRNPYTPTSEAIRDASNRVILPIEYRGATHIHPVEDEYGLLDYIQVNRTRVIDDQVKAIREQKVQLVGFRGLQSVIIEHLCDMVRVEQPDRVASWEKLTGNDHFLHALVLMRASIKIKDVLETFNPKSNRSMFGIIPVAAPITRPLGCATGLSNIFTR